ncbi:MAG: DUF262 domain-containing protein [Nitrospirae bacterium]|nr:DUF262 domain-containing protein [Nitrospirota bacterium]
MKPTLSKLEDQSFYDDDFAEVPPPDIVAYNELRSCADLFRMHEQGILQIQPEFQRDIVWKGPDQTRFIDSLIKQLPIPSMCFALDHRAQKWLVIDGLQRISTIIRFLEGGDWKLSLLDDIEPEIAGKSVAAIKTSDTALHHYYTRVENLSVPVTVLRCDFKKKSHMEYLFTIFHRLNTGGMKLNNQEIRNCIHGGTFNNLLKELDKNRLWLRLNKMRPKQTYRFTKQEIMLRFFAFTEKHKSYEGHLAKFLNTYMHANQNASAATIEEKRVLFQQTVTHIADAVFGGEAPPKLSITVLEALLVGVGANVPKVLEQPDSVASQCYKELIKHPHFSETALREGLSKKLRVIERLDTAIKIFAS